MVYERAFLHARASTGRGRNWYRESSEKPVLEARGEFPSTLAERTSVIFPRKKKKKKDTACIAIPRTQFPSSSRSVLSDVKGEIKESVKLRASWDASREIVSETSLAMNARECEIACYRANYRRNERALHASENKLVIELLVTNEIILK